jgi:hypothetical protein
MTLPRVALDPVMLQTLDINSEKAAQRAAPLALGQGNLERESQAMVKSNSRNA